LRLSCEERGTHILMFLFVSLATQMFIHERRPLEMWVLSFCNENPEVDKGAFKLLKIGTSSSCEHGTELLGYTTGA
jgi:hypothetical protein